MKCVLNMLKDLRKAKYKVLSVAIDGALLAVGAAFVLTLPAISAIVRVIDEENR